MGLFNKNKQEIYSLPEKHNNDFIYSVSQWTTEVKLNSKIIVPQGWWCIFVAKDKPCDVLEEGEHIVTLDKIPLVTKLLKLQKPVTKIKHGKQEKVYRDAFKCFVYFVNKKAVENLAWQTDNIVLKKKNAKKDDKKRFDVILSGVTNLKCVDPSSMMKFYLYEWAKVDSFKAQNRACEYVGENVQDIVRKKRTLNPQEIDDLASFSEMIFPELQKEFTKYGMELADFSVTKAIFDRDVAGSLLQEKLQNDIASDEINEMGAEISIADDSAVKENKSKTSRKKDEKEMPAVAEVLDMTENSKDEQKAEEQNLETETATDEKVMEENSKTEQGDENDLPKVNLKSKKSKKEKNA